MNWYVAPLASVSDLNAAGAPSAEVTVCGALSWFVHVTVVPGFTVRVAGLNAKFWMVTAAPLPEGAGAVAAEGCAGAAGPAEEQPADRAARIRRVAHAIRYPFRNDIVP